MRIRSRFCLFKLLINPELYFGDAYSNGSIEVDGDLVKFIEAVYQGLARARSTGLRSRLTGWLNRSHLNSLSDSRENIHHHYDLGNEFYKLWLDQQMVYTCAYFSSPDITLEQAQIAKMDHVCRKLRLRPEEIVIEAGCGWGALALHMAAHYGVRVKAFNISHEQIVNAKARAHALGVEHRVEFIEDDYRNANGRFDAFMSVGMLEHVGHEYYHDLRRVIDRSLDGNGRGLIHSIGRNRPNPFNAWVEKRIFPGAYPPSLREMLEVVEHWDFSVLDVENLRQHYALTLKHWLQRFEYASGHIKEMYDERFVRAWRLYLAGSIAAFNTGDMQLFQVVFARGASNDVPWTRAYLYN
ncbi:MAG: class I SAM-dependent methyltransferase [Burkholderiales bacterium]